VARTFRQFSPLEAYRLDILGSIAGIIAFSVLSFLGAPPFAWGVVVAALLVLLLDRRSRVWQLPILAIMLVLLGLESIVPTDSWSPYYKIRLITQPSGAVTVLVNGIPHQTMEPAARRLDTVTLYGLVYQRTRSIPKDVLIVGAGTGVDVAVALREGVQHIDAVEIDPRIHDIGLQQNPDHPFQDPRVTSYVNDGRAFLEQTTRRYDLILFALPDSLSFEQGAAIPMNYLTAQFALAERGQLKAGETVLVHGAAGGVGTATIQVAKGYGARTIAVVSTEAKGEVARKAGADEVVLVDGFRDAVKELTGGEGVDVVMDVVGGDLFTDSLRSLGSQGRLLVVGFTAGAIPEVRVNRLLLNNIDVRGVGWGAYAMARPGYMRDQWSQLLPMMESGVIDPPIGATYPLEEFGRALQDMEDRKTLGKSVVTLR